MRRDAACSSVQTQHAQRGSFLANTSDRTECPRTTSAAYHLLSPLFSYLYPVDGHLCQKVRCKERACTEEEGGGLLVVHVALSEVGGELEEDQGEGERGTEG